MVTVFVSSTDDGQIGGCGDKKGKRKDHQFGKLSLNEQW